jgi:hypothetical protein
MPAPRISKKVINFAAAAGEADRRSMAWYIVNDVWTGTTFPDDIAVATFTVHLIIPSSDPNRPSAELTIPDVLLFITFMPEPSIRAAPFGPNMMFLREAIRLVDSGVAEIQFFLNPDTPLIQPGEWYNTLEAAPDKDDGYDLTTADVLQKAKARNISLAEQTLRRWADQGLIPTSRIASGHGWRGFPSDTLDRIEAIDHLKWAGRSPTTIAKKLRRAWPFEPPPTGKKRT